MTLSAAIASEIQKLAPSAIIELFEFDATAIGGDLLRFHAGTNSLSQNVVWQGNTYQRYPIKVSGFEYNGTGQFPRPKIQISNLMSAITTIVLENDDLLGAKVTRKRTLAKFLDAVNFPGGVNPSEDDTAEFEDDIYFIDRKSNEDRDVVEFELASSADLVNVKLPNRQIVQNVCVWKYRGAECGFTGAPLYNKNDELITSSSTSLAQILLNAKNDLIAAEALVESTLFDLSNASIIRDNASLPVLQDIQIDYDGSNTGDYFVSFNPVSQVTTAYYAASPVDLDEQYRRGGLYLASDDDGLEIYYIENWEVDAGALATAEANYTAALAAYESAISDLATAQSDYDDALANLPNDDQLYSQDKCGKRLSSCKLRFGENNQLSFGAFPSIGLIR